MKKVLLGTTALVAAGLFAGEARADFDATVNGSWNTAYGFVDEDDGDGESGDGRQNQALNQDWEVHFRALQTLDNGIEVGGRVELEGATHNGNDPVESGSAGSDQIDERWLFFRGGFGELRAGDEDDARKLKSYTAPDPTGFIFGVNSPTFTFNNLAPAGQAVSTNTTIPSLENDSAKVIYFTPSFGGFQLAVSYAPDATQDRSSFGTGGTQDGLSNAWSAGADYTGEFGGFTIGLGGGYTMASTEVGSADPTAWAVGLNLGFAGFTVGGSVAFTDSDTDGVPGVEEGTVYDVGVTYTIDAVTVGLAWSHGEYEHAEDNDADGVAEDVSDDELDHYQLGVGYALGPGVTLAAMVGLFDYDDGGPNENDNEGWQAGIGTGFNF
jgi:outer membrane protein OmpU